MKRIVFGFILGLCALPLTAGASGLWTGSTSIMSPFYTAWQHHQGCGKHMSGVRRGYYGNYRQTFAHCSMTFSTVYVTHLRTPIATPRPTHTPLPPAPLPPATAIPTASPRATDTPTVAAPTSILPTSTPAPAPTAIPTPTQTPVSSDPVLYELGLLNAIRSQFGVAPLSLNATQSNGTATCVGSLGHSQAMAQSGQIWHVNAAYPAASFPNSICVFYSAAGENVGAGSAFGDPRPVLQQLHASMMAEGTSNCGSVVSHACNIINPAFHQVGIGIVVQNGVVWETEDFLS